MPDEPIKFYSHSLEYISASLKNLFNPPGFPKKCAFCETVHENLEQEYQHPCIYNGFTTPMERIIKMLSERHFSKIDPTSKPS